MANRIVGNVLIIDVGSGNVAIPVPTKAEITSARAWFSTTAGKVALSFSNTANQFCILSAGGSTIASGGATDEAYIGMRIDELKVPILTAGTAWVYFK